MYNTIHYCHCLISTNATEMRKIFLFIGYSLFCLRAVCQISSSEEIYKYPLRSIATFCQENTEKPLSVEVLTYDSHNRLEKLITYNGSAIVAEVDYYYNEHGLIDYKDYYSFKETLCLDRTRVYYYDEGNRLVFEGDDKVHDYSSVKEYKYNDKGQLITCNENHSTCYYEYDSRDRLSEKYEDGRIAHYLYAQNHLEKEVMNNGTEITFEYNADGLLSLIRKNGSIVEENFYANGRLAERWSYYLGIDPCFSPCCSQYVTTYQYF